ncbi:hypothetical protein CI088_01485 [Enterococcus plantarum]|uniref:Uncharacterized protein n=1 Tax=Enterococcus plantarum TaxID=1077675 RepID=A0A2W3ZJK0_9ENTE|nr:hypothetical protein [Enterococcus plantarum]PZL77500.1 hypothetical protein CI088_01485 [Enterococcus plantarum]
MSNSVKEIVKWKEDENQFGVDGYTWFFGELENNYLSKLNGTQRNVDMIKMYDFDKEATEYIIHQLFIINQNAASELIDELGLKEPFISDENRKYLESNL